jgi:hypothetical protein
VDDRHPVIRLHIARSPAWKTLEAAQAEQRSVPAVVQARVPKGLAISMYGLNGLLPIGQVRASAEVPRRKQLIVCFASGWGTNRGLIFSALMRTPARSSCRSVCPCAPTAAALGSGAAHPIALLLKLPVNGNLVNLSESSFGRRRPGLLQRDSIGPHEFEREIIPRVDAVAPVLPHLSKWSCS